MVAGVRGAAAHIRKALIEGSKRPEGVSCDEVALALGEPTARVSHTAMNLSYRNDSFFRAKVSHKVVRWFDTKERALEYQSKHQKIRRIRTPEQEFSRRHAQWSPDAQPVIPAGIEIQRIPTPPQPLWTNTHPRW